MNNLQLKIILSAVDKLLTPMKRNLQGSKQLAAGLQQAKKYAQELNNQNLDVTKYRNLSRSIGITSNELKNARARAAELAKSINDTTAPTKAMVSEFERAKTAVNELQLKQNAQISQQQRLRETMSTAGINVKSLASEQRRLKSEMQNANQAVDEQRKKLDQLNDVQKRMNAAKASYQKTKELQGRLAGTGAGLVAGGTAVGATAVKPILEFAKAENSATELKVSMMGAEGVVRKEFGAINELATRLGNKLPGTTSDLQNMMSTLIQQGMTAKAILGGLGESTAYLAVQMKMPYDQAALFASKLQDATGTAEKDMMGLMDVIQRSHYLGVDSDNMLQAYAKMSPALSIIQKKGLEASKALAPLVVMADQSGMAGEASGNAYRKVFQMAMNTKKVHEANSGALAKTGVKLNFTDGKGEFAGIDKLMSELAKLKGLNTEKRLAALKKIFGDDAETLQVLTILIDKGKAGYAEVQKKMADQADIQQRVNAQLGTLTNLWDAASGTFTNALVKFGESVSPEVKALTQWIGDLSERIGNWSARHPVLSSGIMKTVAAVSALMIGMGGLSLALAAILGPLALSKFVFISLGIKIPIFSRAVSFLLSPLAMLRNMMLAVGAAMMTTPIGWVIAGLAAVSVGVVMLCRHWEGVKAFIGGFFDGFLSTMGPMKQYFETVWTVFKGIGSAIGWVVNKFSELITPVKYSSDELKNATNAGKRFGEVVGEAINIILFPLQKLMEGIHWVIDNFDKIGGIGAKVNAQRIAENPALASGVLTGNYGPVISTNNYQPVSMPKPTVNSSVVHAPITVVTQPGQDNKAIAAEVQKQLDAAQRNARKQSRNSLNDRD
jgi:phage tail tape measure protein, TP901 family, core region